MKDSTIQGLAETVRQLQPQQQQQQKKDGNFQDMLVKSLQEVNRLKLESNKASMDLAAGKSQNIHDTMIAMEKANVSFQMMMQVRNRIIEAYQDILKSSM